MKSESNSDRASMAASGSATTASLRDAQRWSSVVVKHHMRLDHAAVDIDTDRVLYLLELELAEPLPSALLAHAEYLCLSWHYGGIWKIMHLEKNNRVVHCQSWRTTEMNHHETEELAKKVEQSQREAAVATSSLQASPGVGTTTSAQSSGAEDTTAKDDDQLPPCVFEWKMQLGTWGDNEAHWFLRDVRPPKPSTVDAKVGDKTSLMSDEEAGAVPMVAQLLAGFSPLEVQIEVNSITTVETVAQTFSADVTWQVTMPALSSIREDSVIRELLDILELDASQFEFTNINSTQEERDMTTSLGFAGLVEFTDQSLVAGGHSVLKPFVETVNHLQFSRRVIDEFSEEMSLYSFPFDQQKLTFDFSTGGGVRESMKITPASVDAGSFAIENYKLGNVFDAVFQDKIFVESIDDSGKKKRVTFALMLERKSGYYVTNVVIPSAAITYLCFISYAPLDDGSLMDTSDRLQIVLTLLLTAVTFKSQVAELIPQVSYFTWIDKYVFFCFVVACLVALENALYPVFSSKLRAERELLGFSFGAFTVVNIVWGLHTVYRVKRDRYVARVLLQVQELSRIVSAEIPGEYREAVLREYLDGAGFPKWSLPSIIISHGGDVFVKLPNESQRDSRKKAKRALEAANTRDDAERKRGEFQKIFRKLNPSVALPPRSSSSRMIRATRPAALEAGEDRHAPRRHTVASAATVLTAFGGTPRSRKHSNPHPRFM